ncbi:MAG: hypothetical protein Q9226_004055 [Calogaya cf. arnoldii]
MTSKFKSALLTALLPLFNFISALTLEITPSIIANALSRPPNLRGPSIPYGYSMRITQDPDKPLNAVDLYICAIEAMYHWAAIPYDAETQNGHSDIIRGLMDRKHVFAETVVEMKQSRNIFGVLIMGKPARPRRGIEDNSENANGSTNTTNHHSAVIVKSDHLNSVGVRDNTEAAAPATAVANTSTSKTITEPNVPYLGTMNITYQRIGTAVDCKLLFSTALDGITYAAADYTGDTWPFSTCYNWSKKMMYQTVQVKIGDGESEWTADLIKRVARLLPQRLFLDNECGEVRFRVEIERIGRVGTGNFQVLDFAPRGRGREGLSR